MWETILTAMLLCSVILATISLILSAYSIAKVTGFERSTHQVEYRAYEPGEAIAGLSEDEKKALLKNEWMDDLI